MVQRLGTWNSVGLLFLDMDLFDTILGLERSKKSLLLEASQCGSNWRRTKCLKLGTLHLRVLGVLQL